MSLCRNSTPLFHPSSVDNFNLKCTLHDNSVANSISNDIVIGGTFQIEWLMWWNVSKIILKPRRNSEGRQSELSAFFPRVACRSRRSDSAPLNSAPISTQPATDFHVGISTPEFRPDDATLKYDVTRDNYPYRPVLTLAAPSLAWTIVHPRCLSSYRRGWFILLGWWRSFNRVGWEYRQPLR